MQLVAFDDLDRPGSGLCQRRRQLRSLIVGIGEDAFDEGEASARATVEDQQRAIAILQIGRMNDDVQQEAECVDQDMALAPGDLLARIKPLRVKRGAPF